MTVDMPSMAEQVAWENASEFGKLAGDPVPVYCEAVNAYEDRLVKSHTETGLTTLLGVQEEFYTELCNWRTKTLTEAGYWDGKGDYTDDIEVFGNGREFPEVDMLIPDLDYDGDFDD